MNKLAVVAAGVGFMLLGYGLGYSRARRFASERADSEIMKMRERYLEVETESEDEEPAEVASEGTPEDVLSNESIFDTDTDKEDRTDYTNIVKKYDKAEDFDKISVQFLEHGEELDDFENDELPPPKFDGPNPRPHTISIEEFNNDEYGYEQVTWTYFRHDNLVLDFFNQEIDDPEEFLGNALEMLANAHDDFILYVRSPEYELEIELILDLRPVAESVAGMREMAQRKIAAERGTNEQQA